MEPLQQLRTRNVSNVYKGTKDEETYVFYFHIGCHVDQIAEDRRRNIGQIARKGFRRCSLGTSPGHGKCRCRSGGLC